MHNVDLNDIIIFDLQITMHVLCWFVTHATDMRAAIGALFWTAHIFTFMRHQLSIEYVCMFADHHNINCCSAVAFPMAAFCTCTGVRPASSVSWHLSCPHVHFSLRNPASHSVSREFVSRKFFTASSLCFHPSLPSRVWSLWHTKWREKQHGPKHEPPRDVGGASNCVSAHRGNPFPRGIVSLICCGEMPKREKISPTFMPDFLLPTWSECTKKEPLNVHYPPSTLGEAIRKLSFCSR